MAYCTRNDIGMQVGTSNVTTWADRDANGDAETISDVVDEAIATADATIDGEFQDGPYTIPFAATVPQLVKVWSARLAAVELYRGRGLLDEGDAPGGKLDVLQTDTMRTIRSYASGSLRLPLAQEESQPTVPIALR